MFDILVIIVASMGALFTLLGAVGIIRMPDTLLRLSATTKAATLGSGFMLVVAAMYFNTLSVNTRVIVIILFLFLTAPVSAHLISRAAYRAGNKLWDKSEIDDLEGKYDDETGKLNS